jgi:hypothetical protein
LSRLLDDDEGARLLGRGKAAALWRRNRQPEAGVFPQLQPIVKRHSPMEIQEWIDGKNGLQSGSDSLLEVAGKWEALK